MTSSSSSSNPAEFEVPEGWVLRYKRNRKGGLVRSYRNIVGQEFYSESDLMRNIKYSKERGINLYAPDFVPPATGPFAMRSKPSTETASCNKAMDEESNLKNNNQNEVDGALSEDEIQCARKLLELSSHRSFERRVSRRVAGLQPELHVEFEIGRALEYIIKDKHHH